MRKVIVALIAISLLGGCADATVKSNTSNTAGVSENNVVMSHHYNYDGDTGSNIIDATIVEEKLLSAPLSSGVGCIYIVEIVNSGTEECFISMSSVDIEYSDGTLATNISLADNWPRQLQPGESTYWSTEVMINDNADASMGGIGKPILHYSVNAVSTLSDIDSIDHLDITEDVLSFDSGWPRIKGRIVNNSESNEDFVHYMVTIRDGNTNSLLGVEHYVGRNVSANGTLGFDHTLKTIDLLGDYTNVKHEIWVVAN